MEPTDLTIEILENIRDEVRLTRTDLSTRIDATRVRLETLREDSVTELAGAVSQMTGILRASHDLRPRVERCELDIAELKKRIGQ